MPRFNILRWRSRALLFISICTISLVYALLSTNRITKAAGSTIIVNTTADVANNADSLCTLREAITAANTDIASGGVAGECVAGSSNGPDTIDLTGLSGSIALATALPNITSDATLTGPGTSTLTIQRSGSTFGIFTVSSSVTVTITGVAIQGDSPNGTGVTNSGNATLTLANCKVSGFGRGVANDSTRTLTISNCVVTGNLNGNGVTNFQGTLNLINTEVSGNDSHGLFGPGIDNSFGGILNVTNSTISGNVGHNAISNSGTATFTNTTISNNGERGLINNGNLTMTGGLITGNKNGGIILGGTAVMNGVTVSDNSNSGGTGIGGGGIFINGNAVVVMNCLVTNNGTSANGGGIRNGGGKATLINTTISGNIAGNGGGGLDTIDGGLASFLAVNLTVTGNRATFGGGVLIESGVAKFKNSIIAGNLDATGLVPFNISGVVDASSSYNLIGVGGTGGLDNGVNNNQVNVADPRLGPLANNGGSTRTHALLSDSPALDAGDNCVIDAAHCGEPTLPQLTTDQRRSGFNRIVDGPDANATATVDIGAYEMQLPLASLPDTTTNEDTQLIVPFDAGDTSTITSITATSSNTTLVPNDVDHLQAALAGSTGVVTINPTTDLFGTTDITITVNRTAGREVKTFTLTVNSSNDAPSFTKGSDQTVLEDAGAQTVNNWATNLSNGPADEAGQTLTFAVTGNTNPTMFSAGPAIGSTGTLTYTPAPNANGTATVTIVLKDSGGTANAGVDTSVAQTFVITVTPVNDVPTFTKGPDQTVNEDSGAHFLSWATNVSTGAANESQGLTFEVTNNTNPALFSIQPGVNFIGQLSYQPAANANGSAEITIRLKDNGGTANGGVDTTATQTFTITVLAVNDPPALTGGVSQIVNEDSGPQTVTNWATFTPGPADEAGQTLTITVTNNNNALFSTQPDVSLAGTLTYTPAANATGFATVTVTLKDNGGTANGGQDTLVRNFFIALAAVNDPPVNTVPGPQTVIKNSALFFSATESNQISIADIDGGNAARQVKLSATNGLLTLNGTTGLTFSSGNGTASDSMTFTGTIANINAALNGLRFAPTNNFVGTAQIEIATNDLGNTGSGGPLTDTDTVSLNVVDGNALQFSASSFAVVEGSNVATITVVRIGNGGAASVNYSTSDGTASAGACGSGADYVTSSGMLIWAVGETNAKTFTVPICEDLAVETEETVNLTLSGITGDASLGGPRTAVLTITDSGAPVLLTEENTDRAIALDLVQQTRDPFSLSNEFNLVADQRRRISLFVWRLALRPTDTASDLIAFAEDNEGRNYPLTVEFVGAISNPLLVTQVVVRLPDSVIGAPRDLKVTVQLRGQATNKGVITISAP